MMYKKPATHFFFGIWVGEAQFSGMLLQQENCVKELYQDSSSRNA